ncbi:MAG: cupin domain-containing protein [Pseudomonadota bacterium]
MPVFDIDSDPTVVRNDPTFGSYKAWDLGGVAGLTQFGAYVEQLQPGAVTSLFHWHAEEDEFLLMLSGEMVLYEGENVTMIGPGQGAAFLAGDDTGHYLRNESQELATYLVVGTRSEKEVVTYPRHNRILRRDGDDRKLTDLAGEPAELSPYELVASGVASISGET